MAMYLIERIFQEPLNVINEIAEQVTNANKDVEFQRLHSCLIDGGLKRL